MPLGEDVSRLIRMYKSSGPHENFKVIAIEDNEAGKSFQDMFGEYFLPHCLAVESETVVIQDPYIYQPYQISNFKSLCDFIKARCPNLKKIVLRTKIPSRCPTYYERPNSVQISDKMVQIMHVTEIHSRKIYFNTRLLILMDRGLDIWKDPCRSAFRKTEICILSDIEITNELVKDVKTHM